MSGMCRIPDKQKRFSDSQEIWEPNSQVLISILTAEVKMIYWFALHLHHCVLHTHLFGEVKPFIPGIVLEVNDREVAVPSGLMVPGIITCPELTYDNF